jgi:transcriptional regulator
VYQPPAFREPDPDVIRALVAEFPLATLVTTGPDGALVADHVPLLLDRSRGEHGTLVGHVARANPVWRTPGPTLAIFNGPDAYVSPAWYPSKQVDGQVVPTWNYAVVHAHGTLRAVDDPGTVLGIVGALTRRHEAVRTEHAGGDPWRVDDAPDEYVQRMLRAIVGIEIEIDRIDAKSKLSQNRSDADRAGVIAGLRGNGAAATADRIR